MKNVNDICNTMDMTKDNQVPIIASQHSLKKVYSVPILTIIASVHHITQGGTPDHPLESEGSYHS